MILKDYLAQKNMKLSDFAAQAGLEVSTASRAKNGRVLPSRATIEAIDKATGGKVTAVDFYQKQAAE